MTNDHYDYVARLPDGTEWRVRAYHFLDPEVAKSEWERVEAESLGKGNFSIWRTMIPGGEGQYIVLCGRAENLPAIVGGSLAGLDHRNAHQFVLRRLRTGTEAFAEHPEAERFDQRRRYGVDTPVVIDETGGVKPYRGNG